MKKNIGFLKRSQEFREDVKNGKYIPVLDALYEEIVISMHQNDLPAFFSIKEIHGFSAEDFGTVLSTLYPERKYACNHTKDKIFCVLQ